MPIKIQEACRTPNTQDNKSRPNRIIPDFLVDTLEAWTYMLKTLRCQHRILYPEKLSITIDGKNISFLNIYTPPHKGT